MTLSLVIILNTVLDAALVGLLAFAMTRPTRLRPHRHPVRLAEVPRARAAVDRRMADAA